MSETRARASRFARWLGSFDRNGLSGRLAPPSVEAGETGLGGGPSVRDGVGGRLAPGTKGGADGAGNGDDAGDEKDGAAGGVANSGSPGVGDGGVAVAAAVARSIASGRGQGPSDALLVIVGGSSGVGDDVLRGDAAWVAAARV